MKKSKFIKSTIILIVGGFLTKLLGMLIKIVMTRLLGTKGIGTYMLISPTFTLLIGLASLGMPVAISKLVAEDKRNNKNLVFSAIPIVMIINILIIIILIFITPIIANKLLNEPKTYYAIMAIGMVLPFISISSILRGYFFGKEKMIPHVVSNITEDIVRLIIIAIGIPYFLKKGLEYAMAFIVLSNIASELTSIFILFFFLPKNFQITKNDLRPVKNNIKEIMNIGLPTTASRLIGSIGYFLEPIILTYALLKIGLTNDQIITEYGIINGYIMPLLLLPSFFTMAISQALVPTISHAYANGYIDYTKNKIKQAIFFSLLIGLPVTVFFEFFPKIPLNLIYNTTEGIIYLRVIAPICLFYYIQSPVTSALQAMGKAKEAMLGTLEGMIIRTISLLVGCLSFGIWGLIIATSLNMIYVTIHQIYHIKKSLQ